MKRIATISILLVISGCITFQDGSLPDALKIPEMKTALGTAKELEAQSTSLDTTAIQFDSELTSVANRVTRIRALCVGSATEELIEEVRQVKLHAEELVRLGNQLLMEAHTLEDTAPQGPQQFRECARLCRTEADKEPVPHIKECYLEYAEFFEGLAKRWERVSIHLRDKYDHEEFRQALAVVERERQMLDFAEAMLRIAIHANQAADMKFLTLLDTYVAKFEGLRRHVRQFTEILPSLPLEESDPSPAASPPLAAKSDPKPSDDRVASAHVTGESTATAPRVLPPANPTVTVALTSVSADKMPRPATSSVAANPVAASSNPVQHLPVSINEPWLASQPRLCECPACRARVVAGKLAGSMLCIAEKMRMLHRITPTRRAVDAQQSRIESISHDLQSDFDSVRSQIDLLASHLNQLPADHLAIRLHGNWFVELHARYCGNGGGRRQNTTFYQQAQAHTHAARQLRDLGQSLFVEST